VCLLASRRGVKQLHLGARPVLGRSAPCALPMPPDPVGQLERSRARPPHIWGPSSARALRALRPSDAPRPRRPARALSRSASPISRDLRGPFGARALRVLRSNARAAPPRAPDPVGRHERSRARPPPIIRGPVRRSSVEHVRVADGPRPGPLLEVLHIAQQDSLRYTWAHAGGNDGQDLGPQA